MEADRVIGNVKKNRDQTIEVRVDNYQGRSYVYMRISRSGEKPDPDRPGMSFRPSTVRGLVPLLTQAAQLAETRDAEISRDGPDFTESDFTESYVEDKELLYQKSRRRPF